MAGGFVTANADSLKPQTRHGSALRHGFGEINNPIGTRFTRRGRFGMGTEEQKSIDLEKGVTREKVLDIRDRVSDMGGVAAMLPRKCGDGG